MVNEIFTKVEDNLIANYTFDNFIVGNSNKRAKELALEVAEQSKKLHSPLFIYGENGVGKTHLIHAIGNYIVKYSDKKVLYVTSEQIVSDFVNMNKGNEMVENLSYTFKNKYCDIDVLIIDNIQFLNGAPNTQKELLNIVNELCSNNKQIIITSDRTLQDLKISEEGLRTCIAMGNIVNIALPDYDLRLEILKNIILKYDTNFLIKPEFLEYIATNCEGDIRLLESAITCLYARITICSLKEINQEFVKETLNEFIK